MKYLSIRDISERWDISARHIQIHCGEECVPGAICISCPWIIPDDETKPKNTRIKSVKYIKAASDRHPFSTHIHAVFGGVS